MLKILLVAIIFLNVSFSEANINIDPNLTIDCQNFQESMIEIDEDMTSLNASKNILNNSIRCISSDIDNFKVINSFTKSLLPETSRGSIAILGSYNSNVSIQQDIESNNSSTFEKILKYFGYLIFSTFVLIVLYLNVGSLLDLARGKREKVNSESIKSLYHSSIGLILLAPIAGIPLISYIIVLTVIVGLSIFYIFLTVFTVWMIPESLDDNDTIDTIQNELRSQSDLLIDNSLAIQTCDISNRKMIQVLEMNTRFSNVQDKTTSFQNSKIQQCILDTKKREVDWNKDIVVLQDDFSFTSQQCFIENDLIVEYECGRTIANLSNARDINTDLTKFYNKFNSHYQKQVREIANDLVQYTCETRSDLNRKGDIFNFQRFCAIQDINGNFTASNNGDIQTYDYRNEADIKIIENKLSDLKNNFYFEFLNVSKKTAKNEVSYILSANDLRNLATSIVHIFEKESVYQSKYKEAIISSFNNLKVESRELVSFGNKYNDQLSKDLSRDNFSNTLQKDEVLRRNLETLVSSVSSFESNNRFDISVNNLFECNDQHCDKAPLFAPKLFNTYASEVINYSSKIYLSALAIQVALKISGSYKKGIANDTKVITAIKITENVKDLSFLLLILSIAFTLIIISSIIGYVAFALISYVVIAIKFMFEIPVMILYATLFNNVETLSFSDITKRFIFLLIKPSLIAITILVVFMLMSFIISVMSFSIIQVLSIFIDTNGGNVVFNLVLQSISLIIQIILFIIIIFITIKNAKALSQKVENALGIEIESIDYSQMIVSVLVTYLIYNKARITNI